MNPVLPKKYDEKAPGTKRKSNVLAVANAYEKNPTDSSMHIRMKIYIPIVYYFSNELFSFDIVIKKSHNGLACAVVAAEPVDPMETHRAESSWSSSVWEWYKYNIQIYCHCGAFDLGFDTAPWWSTGAGRRGEGGGGGRFTGE